MDKSFSTDHDIKAALEVLQKNYHEEGEEDEEVERGREVEGGKGDGNEEDEGEEDEGEEDEDEEDNLDVDATGDASQPTPPVDPFKILVRNATKQFGFAPRDVYHGVFRLLDTMHEHDRRVQYVGCSELMSLVKKYFHEDGFDSFSEVVLAVCPVPASPGFDRWRIYFKSSGVASKVVGSMLLEEDNRLRETYHYLRRFEGTSTMAGRVFEAIVHRLFCRGWRDSDGLTPQPTRMTSNGQKPPTFTRSTSALPLSSGPLSTHRRVLTRVNFAHTLDNVTLDGGKYYVPAATDNSFFDSFTVNPGRVITISIFRITLSETYRGSTKGYQLIHQIIKRLLEGANPNLETRVRYFLICPDDKPRNKWRMPVGWNKFNHRGLVNCIHIPIPGALYLFALRFAA